MTFSTLFNDIFHAALSEQAYLDIRQPLVAFHLHVTAFRHYENRGENRASHCGSPLMTFIALDVPILFFILAASFMFQRSTDFGIVRHKSS